MTGIITDLGWRCGGFTTEEIRRGGGRVGFALRTFDGREEVLAQKGLASPHRIGSYGVNLDALERLGAPAIEAAVASADLVVIDEMGPMELVSEAFRRAAPQALEGPKPVLGVIHRRPHPFLDAVRARPDVRLITVTRENRERLVRETAALLRGGASEPPSA